MLEIREFRLHDRSRAPVVRSTRGDTEVDKTAPVSLLITSTQASKINHCRESISQCDHIGSGCRSKRVDPVLAREIAPQVASRAQRECSAPGATTKHLPRAGNLGGRT